MTNILIIGQGTIGKPVAEHLAKQGHHITTVARSPKSYDDASISFWQKDATTLTASELADFEQIVIIVAPSHSVHARSDRTQAYETTYLKTCQHIASLDLPNVQRVLFVSSTSVYGENGGESIDITTPAKPSTDTAHVLLRAEQALQETFAERCIIVRPSGIYGEHSERMIRLAHNAHTDGVPSEHYTNRIHQDDLVFILCQILTLPNPQNLYIASDDDPTTSLAVMAFICQITNHPAPKVIDSPPTGKRIRGNVSHWLTYRDYQMGYGKILGEKRDI